MDKKKAIEILNKKHDFSQVLSHRDLGSCSELVVNRYGDIVTFRVYNNGEVTSR